MIIKYRPDIDGLRAVAVLLVIFYHLGVPFVGGGFIGVDVFYVISGFLIQQILNERLTCLRDLGWFYNNRIKRLQPALIFMVTLVSALSFFILLPEDFIKYWRSVYFIFIFQSNNFFAGELSDYFAPSAEEVPLLHTWSLGIEWQFYIVYPLLFWAVQRIVGKKTAGIMIGLSTTVLIAYSCLVTTNQDLYFNTPARIFEILIGCSTAFISTQIPRRQSALIGTVLIVTLITLSFFYSKSTTYPGINALYICIITAGLILIGKEVSLLASTPLVYIGRISYSLYLFHWPPIALLSYMGLYNNLYGPIIALVFMAVFSHISFQYVEKPSRQWSWLKLWKAILLIAIVVGISRGIYLFVSKHEGLPSRLGGQFNEIHNARAPFSKRGALFRNYCHEDGSQNLNAHCSIPSSEPDAPTIFVIGDSHASHGFRFVTALDPLKKFNIEVRSFGACLMFPSVDFAYHPAGKEAECKIGVNKSYEEIDARRPEIVFFIQRFDASSYPYAEIAKLESGVSWMISRGIKPVVLMQPAESTEDMYKCQTEQFKGPGRDARECLITKSSQSSLKNHAINLDLLKSLKDKYPELVVVNLLDIQCPDSLCTTEINGIPLYVDNTHLHAYGYNYLANRYIANEQRPHLLY